MIEIIEDAGDEDFAAAATLITEYVAALGIDLRFQNFDDEIRNLRKVYGPPTGCLLLANDGTRYAGCVALRRFDDTAGEMKRLYVRQAHRKSGVGRILVETMIRKARELGYKRIVLDTLPDMSAALSLYRSLGFQETEPYYENPLKDARRYMRLDL